jgi:hypothetical protein
MEDKKHTPEGLPVVSEETLKAYEEENERRSNRKGDNATNINLSKIMERENPFLNRYLQTTVGSYLLQNQIQESINFLEGATRIYDILRRQAQANTLERQTE